MALDLMLKTLISSCEFNDLQNKNWNQVSQMIPGTTARQCQKRYEELMKEAFSNPTSSVGQVSTTIRTNRDTENIDLRPSRPSSSKIKGVRNDKDDSQNKTPENRPLSTDQGPIMVIHVCDEAKDLREDFNCPRDLLIREMKYFAEYLTTDAQRLEEVDISVHCDVQIFDWLMKYVKRSTKQVKDQPKLEPTNVISILISSDFLKMDSLVQECIEFCHKHMSAIVATPCNMNCINDKLVTRIADLFTHNEAFEVKDRKDKFKSKLFAKKLEKLFDTSPNTCSPENASTLYKCLVCKRLLTKTLEARLKCLPSRMAIDRRGNLAYNHVRDQNWDVNTLLCELKAQHKSWTEVYWKVWGIINYLNCSRCGESFSCSELGHCRYHPDNPEFTTGPQGEYPCCQQKCLRFDPAQPNKGCKVRDHIVDLAPPPTIAEKTVSEKQKLYDDLLSHRDLILVPYQRISPTTDDGGQVDIFALDEQTLGLRNEPFSNQSSETNLTEDSSKPRLQALTVEREFSCDEEFGLGSSDDEVGDEEECRTKKTRSKRVTVDPQAILLDAPDFTSTKTRKWDSTRSLRWNQDAQREEDQRRMVDMVQYLSKLRVTQDKSEKLRTREYAGGLFARLESQWKATNIPPPKAPNPPFSRTKTRLAQLTGKT